MTNCHLILARDFSVNSKFQVNKSQDYKHNFSYMVSKSNQLVYSWTFSSPEAALLLVSTKNRDLWPSPTPEVRDSRTSRHSAHVQSQVWQIWLVLVSIYCVYKAIQKRNQCRWTRPEVAILGAYQKERGLWGREWFVKLRKIFSGV